MVTLRVTSNYGSQIRVLSNVFQKGTTLIPRERNLKVPARHCTFKMALSKLIQGIGTPSSGIFGIKPISDFTSHLSRSRSVVIRKKYVIILSFGFPKTSALEL